MSLKIWLDEPNQNSSEAEILKYLKYNHNKIHILYAYRLLKTLNLPINKTIAELGALGGLSLNLFKKTDFRKIIVLDCNQKILDNINHTYQNKNIKTYHTDFNNPLPLPDESIDIINSLEVIEHIVKAEFFLKEINRVLKKNGYLLISTPNHAFFMSRWRALKGKKLGCEGIHYRFFTKDHFEEILRKSGFKIIKRNSDGHYPLTDIEPFRTCFKRKRIIYHIPCFLESYFAITFIWLCKKIKP